MEPHVAGRQARALGAGTGRSGETHRVDDTIVAATLIPARWITRNSMAVLFHGLIHNHRELQRDLGVADHDTAALYAAAWARWGEAADSRIVGEYAAITIDPDGPVIRLARSPISAPPLRFHRSGDLLAVASTARAVLATAALKPTVDERKIADGLYLNYGEPDRDWFIGVTRVRVGEAVVHRPDGARARRYYDLAVLPPVRLRRDADYVEAASALLQDGTRAALDGRSAPALALSGGLDSQAVAVSALALLPADTTLLALTGVPEPGWDGVDLPDTRGDERPPVAALARRYSMLRTETVDAAGRSFDYRLAEMMFHAGGPPRNAMNLPWLHDLHARARATGSDILLTGSMGNFTVSFDGSGAPAGWFRRGRWWRLMREVAATAPPGRALRTLARDAVLPHLPALVGRVRSPSLPDWCPLTPDYAREMRVVERATEGTPTSSRNWRVAALDAASSEAGDLNQAMEVIHGVPMRDSMAYRPLVEFCMGLPDEQFWRDGVRRRLLKRVLRGRIADGVIDERRAGTQCADWHARLRRQRGALREEIARLREDPAMAYRLDLDRLQAAVAHFPERTPMGPAQMILQFALPRALTTARFIHSVPTWLSEATP